jgi:uridine kinase
VSPRQPVILGLGGPSGAGKTTLAQELARELDGVHLSMDHYYRDLRQMTIEDRARQNFDHPGHLDAALLVHHLNELRAGRPIRVPEYDFARHTRIPERTLLVESPVLLIVEGILALYYDELRPLYDLALYMDAPDAVCYERRMARDVRERGRTAESVERQYAAMVRPTAEAFTIPSRRFADAVLDGTSPVAQNAESVRAELGRRRLRL